MNDKLDVTPELALSAAKILSGYCDKCVDSGDCSNGGCIFDDGNDNCLFFLKTPCCWDLKERV